jgi:anti-sigma factor RsiW
MSCKDRELEIALYAGGDLPVEEAAEIERHIAGCEECRELLGVYAASRAELAETAADVDEFAVSAVRHRVMAKLRAPRRRFIPVFASAAVTVAAAALVIGIFAPRRHVDTMNLQPPAPAVAHVSIPNHPATERTAVVPHARARRAGPEEPTVVWLETDDPNIVIYWIAD